MNASMATGVTRSTAENAADAPPSWWITNTQP
jgi:hypothetical protein